MDGYIQWKYKFQSQNLLHLQVMLSFSKYSPLFIANIFFLMDHVDRAVGGPNQDMQDALTKDPTKLLNTRTLQHQTAYF